MAEIGDRAAATAMLNDDIGEGKRLPMYRALKASGHRPYSTDAALQVLNAFHIQVQGTPAGLPIGSIN